MAISNIELERIARLNDRINKAGEIMDKLFEGYEIPADVTDFNVKLNYALSEIGDEQPRRGDFGKSFKEAQENYKMTQDNIKEDFISMTNLGNARIERTAKEIKDIQQKINSELGLEEERKAKIVAIDKQIKDFDVRREEIVGPDGKTGLIAEEKAKANEAKNIASGYAKDIAAIDLEIKRIDEEIAKLTEANSKTNDKEILNKNTEEINRLFGEKNSKISERAELTKNRKDKQKEQRGHEEAIENLEGEVRNIDFEKNRLSTEKSIYENQSRLLPIYAEQLKKHLEEFEKHKSEYIKTVESTQKLLNEKGIDVKAAMIVEEPVVEVKEPVETHEPIAGEDELIVGQDEPIKGSQEPETEIVEPGEGVIESEEEIVEPEEEVIEPEEEIVQPEKKEKPAVEPEKKEKPVTEKRNDKNEKGNQNTTTYVPSNEVPNKEQLPAVTPEDKKKEHIKNVIGSSSEDRIKRLKDGHYVDIVNDLKELNKRGVKLTKDEKKDIKNVFLEDKKFIAQSIRDIDLYKFEDILYSIGLKISDNADKKELKNLYKDSYEQKTLSQENGKNLDKYGNVNYGILAGFNHMDAHNKDLWIDISEKYAEAKPNMKEEEIEDFEKYVMTPLKFGTLQQQAKKMYTNPLKKVVSVVELQFQGGNKKFEDIRVALERLEPKKDIKFVKVEDKDKMDKEEKNKFEKEVVKTNNFTDDLKKDVNTGEIKTTSEEGKNVVKNPPESDVKY